MNIIHKTEQNTAIFSDMDRPRERQNRMILLIHGNLKKRYKQTYLQSRNRITAVENKIIINTAVYQN